MKSGNFNQKFNYRRDTFCKEKFGKVTVFVAEILAKLAQMPLMPVDSLEITICGGDCYLKIFNYKVEDSLYNL